MIQISSEDRDGVWFALALNEKKQLIACAFSDRNRSEALRAVKNAIPSRNSPVENGSSANSVRLRELHNLFTGRGRVGLGSLDLSHVSAFRRKVYLLLLRIPRGRVTTYGAIAKKLGSGRYARAVGTAVATNPLPLVIPCHRVVPASFRIGNYGMPGRKPSEGGYVKNNLLRREGVKFLGGKVSKESLWVPR